MSDCPERIWLPPGANVFDCTRPNAVATVEYLRSDIAERQIAELRAQVETLHTHNVAGFDEEQTLRKAAEADKSRLSEALEKIEDVDFDGYSLSELHEYVTDIARAALSGSGAGGWRFAVKDSDGRTWLELRSPSGATALLSCATNHAEGETIASQVLHQFALTLPAAPTGEAK